MFPLFSTVIEKVVISMAVGIGVGVGCKVGEFIADKFITKKEEGLLDQIGDRIASAMKGKGDVSQAA